MFFYIPDFSHPLSPVCSYFLVLTLLQTDPSKSAPKLPWKVLHRQQWHQGGDDMKQTGSSGVHSSAPISQEYFSSHFSVFYGNRVFPPLQMGEAGSPLEIGEGEGFVGKIFRENM